MKKLFTFLFALTALTTVHAQLSIKPVQKPLAAGQLEKLQYVNNTLRSGATSLTINYDSTDRYYAAQHSATDTVFPTNASGQISVWPVNSISDTSQYGVLKYAIQTYDTLVNVNNHFAGISSVNATIRVDSFLLFLSDTNGTHSHDTFTVSVFDKTAASTSGTGLGQKILTTALWSRTYVDSANFFGPGSGNYVYLLPFYPNVTLPAGHTFGIRVDFSGNATDQFYVAASYANTCGNGSANFLASPNLTAPHNSSFFLNYGRISGVYDWNANTPVSAATSFAPCDLIPIQNFYFYPSITVTPGNVGIESIEAGIANFSVYPNPSNGVFTTSVKLETASDVTISVMDMNGRKLFESTDKSVKELSKPINLSAIAAGVYIVNVKTDNGSVNQRIVIK